MSALNIIEKVLDVLDQKADVGQFTLEDAKMLDIMLKNRRELKKEIQEEAILKMKQKALVSANPTYSLAEGLDEEILNKEIMEARNRK